MGKEEGAQGIFLATQEEAVLVHYRSIMLWVQRNGQFLDAAKAKFAREADGWLAAYAKAYGYVVVTGEQYEPDVKRRVPLPNVCKAFDVQCCEVFRMLRDLNVQFEWKR